MKITKFTFITPVESSTNIVLAKEYSKTFNLENEDVINLSSNTGNTNRQQDCIAISQNNDYLLLLVSDGMGGMNLGELASYHTAHTIKEWFESISKKNLESLNTSSLTEILTNLISIISHKIPNQSGATLNMSIIGPNNTLIVNIGDSRTYTIQNKMITLRTQDNSLAFQKYHPKNNTQRNMLRFFRKNNILTNAITKDKVATIKVTTLSNQDYDIICHMTDGISDILTEEIIRICLLDDNPSESLVNETISSPPIYNQHHTIDFAEYIYPHDNVTAITYTKKKRKEYS